jgi:hypothetical protein
MLVFLARWCELAKVSYPLNPLHERISARPSELGTTGIKLLCLEG